MVTLWLIKNSEEDRKNKEFSKRIFEALKFYLLSRYAKIYAPTANHGSESWRSFLYLCPCQLGPIKVNSMKDMALNMQVEVDTEKKCHKCIEQLSRLHVTYSHEFCDFMEKQHSQVMISIKKGKKDKKGF